MKGRFKSGISPMVLAAGLAVAPAVALAQQTAAGSATGSQGSASAATDGAGTQTSEGLADIVVTASKISANVQKLPVAISTIDGSDLVRRGVSQAQDVSKLVPGLQVEANAGGAASIYIRGIGSRVLTANADPAVAFSVDGVYFSRASGLNSGFFDIARVEVVKGPQGTLYGRNATGGAMNIITNKPKLGVRSLEGSLEVGNYDSIRTAQAVNLPLTDNLAIRLAGQVVHRDGYLSDGYNDEVSQAGRVSLAWEPSSTIKVYLSGDYAHQGGKGSAFTPTGPKAAKGLATRFVDPSNPWLGPSDPKVTAALQAAAPASAIPVPLPGTYCAGLPYPVGQAQPVAGTPAILTCSYPFGASAVGSDGRLDNEFGGANLTVDADVGFGTLSAIGGYRKTKVDSVGYATLTRQSQYQDVDQYTGELRLASNGAGPLRWIVGGYYSYEKQFSTLYVPTGNLALSNPLPASGSPLPGTVCAGPLDPDGPGPQPAVSSLCLAQASIIQNAILISQPALVDENYAAFGQATYSLLDSLRLTAGIRYTHERKQSDGGIIQSYYTAPAGLVTSFPSEGRVSFNNTSYRLGVEYDIAPRAMFYAQFATGFHAGGFNLGVEEGPNLYPYKPETVKSYTVGLKTRLFANRLQFNIEGFWVDYDDYQTQRLGRINDGSVACSQLAILPSCPLTVRTENAAAARSRGIEADILLQVGTNGTLSANILYNDAYFRKFLLADTFTGAITDYGGVSLPAASKWTVSAGYQHRFPLANGGTVVAEARTQFKNDTWMWYIHDAGNFQKAYTRTDLTLGYEAPDNRWNISAFVRNLEDKATLQQGTPPDAQTSLTLNTLNAPRTYGVNLAYRF
ncbi:TonB-dependent receptor [Sphingobium sp. V4]|uniref:TonB-dependent receptor n=1 Tax=Sphingobium sp. V4 TaxID=3038927 RepID=UPI002557DEB0|nr:TonB-dependent receptor [Sphingobium sp. V4]WIW88039.1 TonB-dependent receptor [Sphingobium sp. V4]